MYAVARYLLILPSTALNLYVASNEKNLGSCYTYTVRNCLNGVLNIHFVFYTHT